MSSIFGPSDRARNVVVTRPRRRSLARWAAVPAVAAILLLEGGVSVVALGWALFETAMRIRPLLWPPLQVSAIGVRPGHARHVPWDDITRVVIVEHPRAVDLVLHVRDARRPEKATAMITIEELAIAPHDLRELIRTYSGRLIDVAVSAPVEAPDATDLMAGRGWTGSTVRTGSGAG